MSSLRAAPNLTPMIDVMLVLLLIFMIQQMIIPALALPTSRNSDDKPDGGQLARLQRHRRRAGYCARRGRACGGSRYGESAEVEAMRLGGPEMLRPQDDPRPYGVIDDHAVVHDRDDPPRVPDVAQRIGAEQYEIRDLAGRDDAERVR